MGSFLLYLSRNERLERSILRFGLAKPGCLLLPLPGEELDDAINTIKKPNKDLGAMGLIRNSGQFESVSKRVILI